MKKRRLFYPAESFWGRAAQLAVFAALLIAGVLVVGKIGYRCPLRWTVGIECPACGITRAALALLRLDFAGALRLNPLVFVVCAYAVWGGAAWLLGRAEWLHARMAWRIFICLFFIWWAVKIGRFFLGDYPQLLEPQALLPRLFGWIRTRLPG